MTVLERIIRLTGFQPTNYPFMSFDGDSVSRYYSANVRSPNTSSHAARPRADISISPGGLLGRGRFGPAGRRGPPGAGARPDAGGGGPEPVLPGGAVGRRACSGAAFRCSIDGARHTRARGSRLPRQSDGPLLLLQDGTVAPARSRGAGPRACRRVRRHQRGRRARASPGLCRGAGGGRALAPGRNGAHQGGRAASRARARAPGVGRPGGAVRSEEHTSELQSLTDISYAVFCWKKKIPPSADHVYRALARGVVDVCDRRKSFLMLQRPPTSTRQSTLFPYATLFR